MARRRSPSLLAVVVLAGCATAPVSFTAPTPRPPDDAYACALRTLNELGYTLTNSSKESGFITATKQTSGLRTKLLTGGEYHDQLTISIFDDSTSGRRIRATAGRVDRRAGLFGPSTTAIKPSDIGKADATTVLQSCGDGSTAKSAE